MDEEKKEAIMKDKWKSDPFEKRLKPIT